VPAWRLAARKDDADAERPAGGLCAAGGGGAGDRAEVDARHGRVAGEAREERGDSGVEARAARLAGDKLVRDCGVGGGGGSG
jgi:hypothetical protein